MQFRKFLKYTKEAREARKAGEMSDEQINPEADEVETDEVSEEVVEEEAFTTVRQYRHKAKNTLVDARARLSLRNDETKEVYSLLNGPIDLIIKGTQGLSQEQQVERLYDAIEQCKENRESIVAAAQAARDAVVAQADAWLETFPAALDAAQEVLEEAKVFAAERDFEAHQSKKRRAQYGRRSRYTSGW